MNKLQAVLRRRWPILVAALALGLVAGALTQALSPKRELTQYQADQVIVGNRNSDNPVNVEQDALRVNRGEVLAAAADELNIEDSDDIAGKVQVKADKDSNSISLRVYDADPATASEIVQAFADAFLTIVNAELRADDQRLLDELTARATEAQKLLNWGYTAFEVVKLFDAAQPVVSPPVWKGKSNVVNLGRPEAIVVAVPAGSGAKLKTQVVRPNPLVAPFRRGQAIGTLRVTAANDAVLAEVPLLALEAVDEAGVLGRAWDSIRLWIK